MTNPVFGFVYVWMWVGLVPMSHPVRAVLAGAEPDADDAPRAGRVARIDPRDGLLDLRERIGVWPAAVGLFGFAWLELVEPERTTLAVVRVWALVWLVPDHRRGAVR